MCSPQIMKLVKDKIAGNNHTHQHDGGLSRRDFLKVGSVSAAGLMLPTVAGAGAANRFNPALFRQDMMGEVVDLSHIFATTVPTYLLGEEPSRTTQVTVENDGFYIQQWAFGEHAGTHMDAPAHFAAGAATVDMLPPSMFIAPIVVIDISARTVDDADTVVTPDDLMAWESENGEIPAGAFVCMHSGWADKWNDAAAFRNADDEGVQHYPGFGAEAAAMLLEERDIVGVGVDTLSLDPGNSATFDVHLSVLPAGKYGIENLANLDQLIGQSATAMIGVPRYEEGSGGPCRVLAMM